MNLARTTDRTVDVQQSTGTGQASQQAIRIDSEDRREFFPHFPQFTSSKTRHVPSTKTSSSSSSHDAARISISTTRIENTRKVAFSHRVLLLLFLFPFPPTPPTHTIPPAFLGQQEILLGLDRAKWTRVSFQIEFEENQAAGCRLSRTR